MNYKRILRSISLSILTTTIITTNVFAMTFNDVPSTFWGYSSIDSVSNKGLMVGDLNGNFRPNSYIDRFETSKVLARLLGYKYAGATAEEEAYYDTCYNNQISLIQQYDDKFAKWDGSSNREIAFLLEKGVLTNADLNQFVVLSTTGFESINVLTREDIAVFLVRTINEVAKADALQYTNLFNDDSAIQSSKKQSVYYLRSIGIVNGDNNNNYNPKNAVRRSEMSTLLDKTYNYMNGVNTPVTNPSVTTVTTVTGTIDTIYESLNTIQVKTSSGQMGIYVIDPNASVNIDGYAKTKADLKQGMYAVLVVEGGKTVKDIKATSGVTTENTIPTTPTPNTNISKVENITNLLNGTISAVDSVNNILSISTKILSPKGEIITNTNTYIVKPGTTISKGNTSMTVSQIKVGDIITCNVDGQYIDTIIIEQQNQNIEGTIIEKGYDSTSSRSYFVIKTDDDNEVKVYVGANSKILRGGATSSWSNIKVGDYVTCNSTFGVIDNLSANGSRTTDSGYIKEVLLTKTNGYVVITDVDGNNERKLYLSPNIENAYSLKVGAKAKFTLDSKEVTNISILMDPKLEPISGVVQNIYRDRITVIDKTSGLQTVYYDDDDTKFINSNNGSFTTVSNVDIGDEIYAVYSVADTTIATTITVVNK